MRLRRCLSGKLTVGHTIRSSALCFKRFAKKNKLFSSRLKRTNCLWLEKKFILLLYIICTCELEGMKEQAADSCFPVALPAAAAAAAWSAFGISFLSLLSSLAAMSAIALPVWRCLCEKKKFFICDWKAIMSFRLKQRIFSRPPTSLSWIRFMKPERSICCSLQVILTLCFLFLPAERVTQSLYLSPDQLAVKCNGNTYWTGACWLPTLWPRENTQSIPLCFLSLKFTHMYDCLY